MLKDLINIKQKELFFLLFFSYLPISFYLPASANLGFFIVVFISILVQLLKFRYSHIFFKFFVIIVIFYLVVSFRFSIISLDFGAAFLSYLLVLKYIEISSKRDKYIFLFLICFLPVVYALYEQSIFTGIYLILFVNIFLYNLHFATINRKNFKICYSIFIKIIPIVIILFLLVPRLPSAFIGIKKKSQSVTGLSDSVNPGDISRLVLNDDVAFRVKFDMLPKNIDSLYFRCVVHSNCFLGRCTIYKKYIYTLPVQCFKDNTYYTIYLEPLYNKFVPVLEMPQNKPDIKSLSIVEGAFFMVSRDISLSIGYNVVSCRQYVLRYVFPEEIFRSMKVELDENPKTQELVKKIVSLSKNKSEIIQNILLLFKKQFYYSLNSPLWPKKDPIDFFLFSSKRGFCEHYAVATTYMLRYANIPARVVTGYMGGEKNPIGNYLVVRQNNAHAWVEAYLGKDRGFIRIDPTMYISKENIDNSIAEVNKKIFINDDFFLLSKLITIRDYINFKWQEFIVGYDYVKQSSFFSKLGLSLKDVKTYSIVILAIFCMFFIAMGIGYIILLRSHHENLVVKYYLIFLKKLKQKGADIDICMGPLEILEFIRPKRKLDIKTAEEIIKLYIKIRFKEEFLDKDLERFKSMVRRF